MANNPIEYVNFDANMGLCVGNNQNLINWDTIRQGDLQAISSKLTAFFIYYLYFSNIAMSLLKYNCGDLIPIDYIEKAMFQDGRLVFFNGADFKMTNNIQCSTFKYGTKFDHYGRQTEIELFNTLPNTSDALSGKTITDESKFEILYANKTRTSLHMVVYYFCNKIMSLQTAIDNNILNNSLPIAVEGTNEQYLALNNIIKNVVNQNRFLFFKKDRNVRPEELFKSLDINVEYKADKMMSNLQYYKSEFLTMLGLNSTPYEKKERLITSEVESNNQIVDLTLLSMLETQKRCFERINKKFDTNFSVELNTNLNTDIQKIESDFSIQQEKEFNT